MDKQTHSDALNAHTQSFFYNSDSTQHSTKKKQKRQKAGKLHM